MALHDQMTFDELNRLVGYKRSEDLEEYFRHMRITEEQKRQRIRLAEAFHAEFIYGLSLMFYTRPDMHAVNELRDRYIRCLESLGIGVAIATSLADRERMLRMQAEKFAIDAVEVTKRHEDDPYFFSEDRARLMSEDQANWIYDDVEFADAVAAGMRFKTWLTVGDDRVRNTHEEVEGVTIPIDEPFELAGGYMMRPHDTSLGVDENEVINCRCSLAFSAMEE